MSGRQDWGTPLWLFRQLDRLYGPFALDAAATADNTLCPAFCRDGLLEPWEHPTWVNPPYGRDAGGVEAWVRKARYEAAHGVRSVMLLDGTVTSTGWWGPLVGWPALFEGNPRIIHLGCRLTFRGAPSTARFPSVVVVWERV